ncbi:MAG: DUF4296 domain-containing protein [Bacteroidales bacterium]
MSSNRLIYLSLFLSLFLFFASCSWFAHENPCHDTIEKDKMINLLTEIHVLESHLSLRQSRKSMGDSAVLFYAGLFQKYNVSAEEFDKAYECYMLDRELMTEILDEVLNNLSIAQSKADAKKENEEEKIEFRLDESQQIKE